MGMGLEGAFGATALRAYLMQREQAQIAAQQRAFNNGNVVADNVRQDAMLTLNTKLREDAQRESAREHAAAESDRTIKSGLAMNDAIPGGTELPMTSPAVPYLQAAGAPLQHADPNLASTSYEGVSTLPSAAGGSMPVTTPMKGSLRMIDQSAKPERYIKGASAKQIDTTTDNTRQAAATAALAEREAATTAETNRHNRATEAAAGQKPDHAADTRMDRSYQYHRTALDKIAKPLEDQQQRMGRLIESVNQGSPQADALVAPELLTVMAGGAGSGLRMNEAEISRIIGGRSKWETLKATLNQWSSDPTKANSITPDQRQQIRALITAVHDKSQKALAAVNEAGDSLVDAPDVVAHRRVLGDTRKKLQQIFEPPDAGAAGPSGGDVYARDPQGNLHKAKAGTPLPDGWKVEQH